MYILRNSSICIRGIHSLALSRTLCALCENFSLTQLYIKQHKNEEGSHRSKNVFKTAGLLIGLGAYVYYNKYVNNANVVQNYLPLTIADCVTTKSSRRDQFNFIADVVEAAAESVVYIEIIDPRVRAFYGQNATVSNGSGFIVHSDGLILTNAHVVVHRNPSAVRVKLTDGRTFQGVVENVDVQSDLATVRIKAENLPTMKLGSSNDLRPGEWVVAIGSPLTLSNTVTAGVVSASGRSGAELGIQHSGINYIQTDASITFGNSGGPLVNLDGEAIGINSIKVSPGISFAIPIDHAKSFLSRIQSNPAAPATGSGSSKKFIGITLVTLRPKFLSLLKARSAIPETITSGVLVWKVAVGGPAYTAGLRPGDVITQVNSKSIDSVSGVYSAMESSSLMSIRVFRNGEMFEVQIQPEEL